MEISARVLREVEFNSSLRGYNTDEVDEFLEQVADAVDRLQTEAKSASERAEQAERAAAEAKASERSPLEDDDSIRRTLVLAQRTADLAIKEAQEEAAQILDHSRAEAESLVASAREAAQRMTSDAERRLREEVARLGNARDDLRKELDTLVSLLGAERERLTETLGAALRYVERSLAPSAEILNLTGAGVPAEALPGGGVAGTGEAVSSGGPEGGGAESSGEGPGDAATGSAPPMGANDRDVEGNGKAGNGDAAGSEGNFDAAPKTTETPTTPPSPSGSSPSGEPSPSTEESSRRGSDDELEAAIAEDAAAAAPAFSHQPETEHYDWDSVMRGQPEPMFGDRPRVDRPSLTPLPSMEDVSPDRAAMKSRNRGSDWPA